MIALGSDDDVRGTSRGDSHVIDLGGACVVALGEGPDARWPPDTTLEVGGHADLAVLESDPRLVDPHGRSTGCRPSPSSAADVSLPEGCPGSPATGHDRRRLWLNTDPPPEVATAIAASTAQALWVVTRWPRASGLSSGPVTTTSP